MESQMNKLKENEIYKYICSQYPDPKDQYRLLFEIVNGICQEQNWGEPFSYARSREIHMAIILNHQIADTYSGADAIDELGECEYKSTISKNINATYNGISVMPTWPEQIDYIKTKKIGKYKNHYYARYEGSDIKEIWKLNGDTVSDLIIKKIENQYKTKHTKKDPRLGTTISKSEIIKHGIKVYG